MNNYGKSRARLLNFFDNGIQLRRGVKFKSTSTSIIYTEEKYRKAKMELLFELSPSDFILSEVRHSFRKLSSLTTRVFHFKISI